MFRHALDNGLALYLYSATAHGYFERRAAGKAPAREYQLPAIEEAAVKLEALAAEAGVRPSEMILAALLQLAPQVRAIIGATLGRPASPELEGWRDGSAARRSCVKPWRQPAWATFSAPDRLYNAVFRGYPSPAFEDCLNAPDRFSAGRRSRRRSLALPRRQARKSRKRSVRARTLTLPKPQFRDSRGISSTRESAPHERRPRIKWPKTSTASAACRPTCSSTSTRSRPRPAPTASTSSISAWAIPTCRRPSTSSTSSRRR